MGKIKKQAGQLKRLPVRSLSQRSGSVAQSLRLPGRRGKA